MKRSLLKSLVSGVIAVTIGFGGVTVFADTNTTVNNEQSSTEKLSVYMIGSVYISSEKDTEVSIPITINGLPKDKKIRSVEIVFQEVDSFDISGVEINKGIMDVENISYNLKDSGNINVKNEYRIALYNTSKQEIQTNWTGEGKFGYIKLKLRSDRENGSEKLEMKSFIVRCDNDEDISYDVTSTGYNINIENDKLEIEPRLLYKGDGNDIEEDLNIVAVDFKNLPDGVLGLGLSDSIQVKPMYYSPELSKKNNVSTYLVKMYGTNTEEILNRLKKWDIYERYDANDKDFKQEEVIFGDFDNNGIDAQDAIEAINIWTGKTDSKNAPILSLNVNADSSVNTRDAIDIVDNYISKKEFKILSK